MSSIGKTEISKVIELGNIVKIHTRENTFELYRVIDDGTYSSVGVSLRRLSDNQRFGYLASKKCIHDDQTVACFYEGDRPKLPSEAYRNAMNQ